MEHNTENIIKVAEAMIHNKHCVREWCKKTNNEDYYKITMSEILGMRKILDLITDEEFFEHMAELYREDIK